MGPDLSRPPRGRSSQPPEPSPRWFINRLRLRPPTTGTPCRLATNHAMTPPATLAAPLSKPIKRAPRAVPSKRQQLFGAVLVVFPHRAFELPVGGSCVIGRDASCDVVLNDALISRRHVRIFAMTDRVVLTDLMSTNGVYINGLRVDGLAHLRADDRIVLGSVALSVL